MSIENCHCGVTPIKFLYFVFVCKKDHECCRNVGEKARQRSVLTQRNLEQETKAKVVIIHWSQLNQPTVYRYQSICQLHFKIGL
jgi:hypothetical protein